MVVGKWFDDVALVAFLWRGTFSNSLRVLIEGVFVVVLDFRSVDKYAGAAPSLPGVKSGEVQKGSVFAGLSRAEVVTFMFSVWSA